jgi:hypothetical protein
MDVGNNTYSNTPLDVSGSSTGSSWYVSSPCPYEDENGAPRVAFCFKAANDYIFYSVGANGDTDISRDFASVGNSTSNYNSGFALAKSYKGKMYWVDYDYSSSNSYRALFRYDTATKTMTKIASMYVSNTSQYEPVMIAPDGTVTYAYPTYEGGTSGNTDVNVLVAYPDGETQTIKGLYAHMGNSYSTPIQSGYINGLVYVVSYKSSPSGTDYSAVVDTSGEIDPFRVDLETNNDLIGAIVVPAKASYAAGGATTYIYAFVSGTGTKHSLVFGGKENKLK